MLKTIHKEVEFGVGDEVRVTQIIEEADKKRTQSFEGIVISIKGREENSSFTVRRIGAGQIGIERIFPLSSPNVEKIKVVRHGVRGVNSAKLYYIRYKSKRDIEEIYSRAQRRGNAATEKKATKKKSSGRSKNKNK